PFPVGRQWEDFVEVFVPGRHVLSLRELNHRGHDHSRRKYRFHHDAPVMTLLKPPPRQRLWAWPGFRWVLSALCVTRQMAGIVAARVGVRRMSVRMPE